MQTYGFCHLVFMNADHGFSEEDSAAFRMVETE
jgi:hypothetical protein